MTATVRRAAPSTKPPDDAPMWTYEDPLRYLRSGDVIIRLKPEAWRAALARLKIGSDATLARHMGVGNTTVWRLRRGDCEPSAKFMARAAHLFDVGFDELFEIEIVTDAEASA